MFPALKTEISIRAEKTGNKRMGSKGVTDRCVATNIKCTREYVKGMFLQCTYSLSCQELDEEMMMRNSLTDCFCTD